MNSSKARREAAALLGRQGGLKRGKQLREKLPPEARSEMFRKLANQRWHPETKEQQPAN